MKNNSYFPLLYTWLPYHTTYFQLFNLKKQQHYSMKNSEFQIWPLRQSNIFNILSQPPCGLERSAKVEVNFFEITRLSHLGPGLALWTYLPPTANSSQIGYMYPTWKGLHYTVRSHIFSAVHASFFPKSEYIYSRGRKSFATTYDIKNRLA